MLKDVSTVFGARKRYRVNSRDKKTSLLVAMRHIELADLLHLDCVETIR